MAFNRELYEHIIAQLQSDGLGSAAGALSEATQIYFPAGRSGSDALARIYERGRRVDGDASFQTSVLSHGQGLSLDGSDAKSSTAFPNYVTKFITTHKNNCKTASFNSSGTIVATGSADTAIKIIDVERMKVGNLHYGGSAAAEDTGDTGDRARPVVRTYYDHTAAVNDVQFHPSLPWLASASRDGTVRFYDMRTATRHSSRTLRDPRGLNVRSLSFHPSGDFLLVGTDDPIPRLYDVATLSAYCAPSAADHHAGSVSQVCYGALGNAFATCSKDGTAKVWDGVSGRCVRTLFQAHGGFEVCSARFSANQRYLLTSGKDGTVKLWEVGSGREVRSHAASSGPQQLRTQAVFSWNEELIVGCDEAGLCAVLWDSRTGTALQRLSGHQQAVRCVAASSVEPAIVTCSNDFRVRFWLAEPSESKE